MLFCATRFHEESMRSPLSTVKIWQRKSALTYLQHRGRSLFDLFPGSPPVAHYFWLPNQFRQPRTLTIIPLTIGRVA